MILCEISLITGRNEDLLPLASTGATDNVVQSLKDEPEQTSTCRFLAQLSLFRPPVLTMADQAVAATYGMDAASTCLRDLGLWDT